MASPKVGETVKNIEGAWVKDTKAVVRNGSVAEWRVTLAVTFIVD
ncbi:MAG: dodecin family protein [Sphingomonas sp.]|nr:dodecin family protein [Sphingomonas sp.]